MSRRFVLALLVTGLILSSAGAALALWTSSGSGPGQSPATTVNSGNPPAAVVSGRTVQLSWAASTLANGAPVTGYVVKRYDSTGLIEQGIASGTCAAAVTGTTCSQTATPVGNWRYSVTPVHNNWSGPESTKTSATVVSPTISLTVSVAKSPSTVSGTITNFIDGETIRFYLDSTSGTELAGTVDGNSTPAAVPTGGSAPITVDLPPGTTEGAHTIIALASPSAETASTPLTVDNTPPPAPSITSQPPNPSASSSPSFSFTDAEPGVGFECQLDAGGYSSCTSPKSYAGVADGSHTFYVRAVDAAGNTSGATSYTWTVDTTKPAGAITFPASGSTYGTSSYTAGCGTPATGDLCGTASDAGGVTSVQVSIRRISTGNWWDGTTFGSASEVPFTATGTTSWSYNFAAGNFPADGNYRVHAVATDAAGNTGSARSPFTMDVTAPGATDVQTANGGTPPQNVVGRADKNDSITFTYSEQMDPASILAGWNGSSTSVVVRITDGGAGNDTLTIWNSSNAAQLPLGSVNLGRSDYVTADSTFGATGLASSMVQSGNSITVTFGNSSGSFGTVTVAAAMTWTPSATATDLNGNACSTTPATESGAADVEF